MQLLHHILTFNDFGITTVSFLSKLLASLIRNYFPKRASGAPLHTLSKLHDVPVSFVNPPPSFEAVYCYICGCRRVAVARYRMIFFVLVNSHLFLLPCGAGKRYYSCIISHFQCWAAVTRLAALQYFTFFSSRMHIFKHSYLCTFASRGTFPCAFGVNHQV